MTLWALLNREETHKIREKYTDPASSCLLTPKLPGKAAFLQAERAAGRERSDPAGPRAAQREGSGPGEPTPTPGGSSRGKQRLDGDFKRGKAERPPHVPRPPRRLSTRPRPGPARRRRAEERGRAGSALHTCPGCLSSCARSGAAAVAAGAGARLCPGCVPAVSRPYPSSAPLGAALRLTPRARARTRPPRRAHPHPAPPRGARAAWEPAAHNKGARPAAPPLRPAPCP